jgi:DNA-binding NarL/FixJ family response regulator
VVRACIGLAYTDAQVARPERALRYAERGRTYAAEHQVDTLLAYLNALIAWLHLRAGEWDEAERLARSEAMHTAGGTTVSRLLARTVLTELAVRRGDAEAAPALADLVEEVKRTGELQRIGPVLELELESALLRDEALPVHRLREVEATIGAAPAHAGEAGARLAAWAAIADVSMDVGVKPPIPYAAMLEHDWNGAADAFGDIGWDYDRALMLSLLDDEAALAEAIEIARRMGAAPLAARVARQMKSLGFAVRQGPRRATLANPTGLTRRQLEVLELLGTGLTNTEIAERLYISPRTAEHHVEAILVKLGASTRMEAARRYAGMDFS